MKKFNVTIQRGPCAKCHSGEARIVITGNFYADAHIEKAARILEHSSCYRKEVSVPSQEELSRALELAGLVQALPPARINEEFRTLILPPDVLRQIEADTEDAIRRGWDAANSEWRKMALMTLCRIALSQHKLSVNDFRDEVKRSEIKTHNYAALGGLMTTARRWGWIKTIGDEPSPVSHHGNVRLWESLIFQEPSNREKVAEKQKSLFA